MDSGYDWNIHSRVLPRHKMTCVVPDASRSQNIGQFEGWASRPEHFPVMQAASFRSERGLVEYRLVTGDDVPPQDYVDEEEEREALRNLQFETRAWQDAYEGNVTPRDAEDAGYAQLAAANAAEGDDRRAIRDRRRRTDG